MPYVLLLNRNKSLPIEIVAMERVVEYIFKVQKSSIIRFSRIAWEVKAKAKFWLQVVCNIWRNGLEDGMQHTYFMRCQETANDASLQNQHITEWEKCGGSCVTRYTMYIAPNHITMFFSKCENWTRGYMLELFQFPTIRTNVPIRDSSHSLRDEIRCQLCVFSLHGFGNLSITIYYNPILQPHSEMLSTYPQPKPIPSENIHTSVLTNVCGKHYYNITN